MKKKKSISKKKKKLMFGKGPEYSGIAREMEGIFANWLDASGISEEEFMGLVDSDGFSLVYDCDEEQAAVTLYNRTYGEIAAPLIWMKENGIPLKSYKVDTALLLFLVASKCKNQKVKEKIESFLKTSFGLVNARGRV